MYKKLKKKVLMFVTAMQAGRIVGKCKWGCYLDNENEMVVPCHVHANEITYLSERNQENW